MTREEFIKKAKEKYGPRGETEAKAILYEVLSMDLHQEDLSETTRLLEQSIMEVFFEAKEKAKEKFTPKKYRMA